MKTQELIKLSAIVSKLGIKDELKNIDKATNEEVGKELLMIFINNLYKAEEEVYQFVATRNKISVDEAKEVDIIAFFKDFLKIEGLSSFLGQ